MRHVLLSMIVLLSAASTLFAQPVTYNLVFSGAAEVPGPGDPDGAGSGTITFYPNDPASPFYGSYSYDITFQNVAQPLSDAHIHGPNAPVGVAASPYIGMGVGATAGEGPGTFIKEWNDGNYLSRPHWTKSQLETIVANPSGFYLNLHNDAFPGGAIRAQLPEPASLGLLLMSGLALIHRRRA